MGVTEVTTSQALTSWTRTLNVEDAFVLVDTAFPDSPVADWIERGDRLLPQASPARRRELIKIVREELLDTQAGMIVGSAWLRLFQDGSVQRRKCLLFARLWRNRPLVERALETLVHPALTQMDRPLAPHDSDRIEPQTWDRFLRSALRPDVPSEAFAKTRSTLQGALRDVGVLDIGATRERITRVQHGRPDAVAFAWAVANELKQRGEESEGWAARESFAARLFAPRVEYAATCIEAGIAAGLLRRGHLMTQSRLQLGSEMSA
jgi:hypothetical protein